MRIWHREEYNIWNFRNFEPLNCLYAKTIIWLQYILLPYKYTEYLKLSSFPNMTMSCPVSASKLALLLAAFLSMESLRVMDRPVVFLSMLSFLFEPKLASLGIQPNLDTMGFDKLSQIDSEIILFKTFKMKSWQNWVVMNNPQFTVQDDLRVLWNNYLLQIWIEISDNFHG